MAQSQPFLGRLEPFYGWYKRVVHKPTKEKPAARKSTFGFSLRISQRSKNQKSFHFPTATQNDKFTFQTKK